MVSGHVMRACTDCIRWFQVSGIRYVNDDS